MGCQVARTVEPAARGFSAVGKLYAAMHHAGPRPTAAPREQKASRPTTPGTPSNGLCPQPDRGSFVEPPLSSAYLGDPEFGERQSSMNVLDFLPNGNRTVRALWRRPRPKLVTSVRFIA